MRRIHPLEAEASVLAAVARAAAAERTARGREQPSNDYSRSAVPLGVSFGSFRRSDAAMEVQLAERGGTAGTLARASCQ